ncbi:histidine kinase [Flavobacterium sp.]|uniref:histidine kinase n=5 Tax=Flavobacterium sp. TaxID=239 RepID=UPI00404832C2
MKSIFYIVFTFLFLSINSWSQQVYHENITQESGLPNENVYDIYKDSKGYIWFTTDEGLVRYNGYNYKVYKNELGLSVSGTYIKEDFKGRIWYQTFDGILFYVENDILKCHPTKNNLGFKPYFFDQHHLVTTSGNNIEKTDLRTQKNLQKQFDETIQFSQIINNTIITGNENVFFLDKNTLNIKKKIKKPETFISLLSFSNNKIVALADRSQKNTPIVLIDENGVFKKGTLNLTETLQNLYLLPNEIWCFTKNGVQVFDYNFKHLPEKDFLTQKNVSSFARDKNEFLWIGSPTNGIYLIKDLNSKQFEIENDEFSSISFKNNEIYTGTNKGIVLKHKENLVSQVFFDTKEKNHILFMDFNSIKNFNFFTGNGFYWQNELKQKTIRNFYSVKDIAKVNEKSIAVAATGLSKIIDLEDNNFSVQFLENKRCKSIAYDSIQNKLFIATNEGLFVKNSNQIVELTRNKKPLFLKKIRYVSNNLIGLSPDGKIIHINNQGIKNIKCSETINQLHTFQNKIYLSSNFGIYLLDNNIPKKIISVSNFHKIKDFIILNNNAFVITKNKLIKIPLQKQLQGIEKPIVKLTKIQKEATKNKLTFDTNVDKITILFELLNFDLYNDYIYYYELNGKKININPTQLNIELPNLNSGNYTFQMHAKKVNETSPQSSSESISFEILPPFWKRTWFIIISFIVLGISFFFFYRRKINILRKKNEIAIEKLTLENNLKESRLQLIKSQMNPHFFFNAINNIQSYIFTNETKEASQYLSKFSKLTRKILEFSEVNTVSLNEEIEALTLYLELQQMRFKDFHYEIKLENISHPERIKIPTMLFQPYIENAILHGLSHSNQDKKLEVKFHWNEKNVLTTTIYDNGIGRVKSAELNRLNTNKAKSFATKANLERIMLLNKNQYQININYEDLHNENLESNGTLVTITIAL